MNALDNQLIKREGRITLTAEEVAKMLGMSKRFVYELAQRGELPCKRFGRKVLFSRQAIETMVEE
ncbi:MAG: helix-turn-helix domain-containing protein [Clostridiales bacterium]|nr:helix-turn-helix domain-containing protein [Clostridiales bacterium]